jgi:hypothetical protein
LNFSSKSIVASVTIVWRLGWKKWAPRVTHSGDASFPDVISQWTGTLKSEELKIGKAKAGKQELPLKNRRDFASIQHWGKVCSTEIPCAVYLDS